MFSKITFVTSLLLSHWTTKSVAVCDYYSPAFPLPQLSPDDQLVKSARNTIKLALDEAITQGGFDTSSYSIEVTSSTETLFELHHTAADKDAQRPGAETVDGSSCYRIASITKSFTVLAILQQQIAGRLDLDDPVNLYIPELGEKSAGGIPWKDISIRTLASQLSGIPRDIAQADILAGSADPTEFGLPPVDKKILVPCDRSTNYTKPCDAHNLLDYLDGLEPIFPPKQQSTYSNLNYELLGLVIQNVTGVPFEDYVQKHILKKLGLSSTSFSKPSDNVAVLPKDKSYYWDVDVGVQAPTGGLYSSSADLAKFARYVLTHYNGLTPALNWFNPVSYSTGINSFYGTPWEIFRLSHVFPYTGRPITIVTKGGGLPAYFSILGMSPEYGYGFSILVGGDSRLLSIASRAVLNGMIPVVEALAQQQMSRSHTGVFSAAPKLDINSSITIAHSLAEGLHISSWVSNGTDMMRASKKLFGSSDDTRLQLVPTLLFKDELNREGEIWRILRVPAVNQSSDNEFCLTDIDPASYGGLPLNEVVFWDRKGGKYQVFEPTAFRIKLGRGTQHSEGFDREEQNFIHDQSYIPRIDDAKLDIILNHGLDMRFIA